MTSIAPRPSPADTSAPGTRSTRSTARRRSRRGPWRVLAHVVGFAIAVAAGLGAVVVGVRVFGPHAWSGTVFPDPEPAGSLDGLVRDDGTPVDLAEYRGKAVLIYFGYLSCPDVCPTTLSTVAQALDSIGATADDVQLIMVSVDPARDDVATIGRYVRSFDESFVGAGGSTAAIDEAAARYGIYYLLHEPDADGRYDVDHTASITGIDPDGNLKVIWGPDVTAEQLAADLRELAP